MLLRTASALLLGMAAFLAHASELVVIGYIEKVSIQSFKEGQCTKPCADMVSSLPNGSQRICISNACGCQDTEVVVDRVLVGEYAGKSLHVHDQLGEWCKALHTPSFHPVLLKVDGERSFWSPLERRADGEDYFDPKRMDTIGGVPVTTLKLTEGKARLSDLMKALPKGR